MTTAEVKECLECGSYYDARSLQCPCELIKEGDIEIAKLKVHLAAAYRLAKVCHNARDALLNASNLIAPGIFFDDSVIGEINVALREWDAAKDIP